MPTPIAVFTGDNHLRPTTWAKHPDLYGDAYHSLRQIVAYCLQNRLPLLLLGDLFDKARPDSLSVSNFLHQVNEMQRAHLDIYSIEGNHDRADPPWSSIHPHVRNVGNEPVILPNSGVSVVGMDFTPAGQLAERIAALPDVFDVVMAHQSWLEIQRVGHVDGTFSMFPRGCVMLTGDYHVCGTYDGRADNGDLVRAWSPGSTSMQALNESPEKRFGVLYDDLTVEWQPLDTRPFYQAVLPNEEGFATFIQSLPPKAGPNNHSDVAKPILKVRYNDEIPEAYDRLLAAVGDDYHLFPEPQRQMTEVIVDPIATPEGAFDSLITAVGELTDPGSPTYNGVRRLLESEDPAAELLVMFEEYKHAQAAQPGTDANGVPASPVE